MTDNIIKTLPDILKKHISTLNKVSVDESRKVSMSNSLLKVIDFDKIPKEYCRSKGLSMIPGSNDALYIGIDKKWYFIEFKNGLVDKANIYSKIYDSLIILLEMGIIPDYEFSRENIEYILVYSQHKYGAAQKSPSRDKNYSYFLDRAQMEETLFGVERFKNFLFCNTHTFTGEMFLNYFVKPMEHREAMYN